MALDASQSLGAAIGLQGEPKDYSSRFAQLSMQQDAAAQRKEQAKQAKKDKEAAETERLAKLFKVDIDGYLPNRIPVVKQRAAEFTNKLMQKRAQGVDVANDPETINDFNNIKADFAAYKDEKTAFQLDRTEADSKPDAFIFDAQYNDYATGKASGDAPIYVRGAALKDKVDYNDYVKTLATGVKQIETGTDKAGLNVVTKMYDPEATAQRAAYFVQSASDPESPNRYSQKFLKETAAEFAADPANQILPAEEKAMAFNNYAINKANNLFKSFQGESKKENRERPQNININMGSSNSYFDPTTETGEQTTEFGFPSKAFGAEGGIEGASKVKNEKSTAPWTRTFGDAKLTTTLPTNTRDMSTGEEISLKKSVPIEGGIARVRWVYKDGVQSAKGEKIGGKEIKSVNLGGLYVPNDKLEEEKKKGNVVAKVMFEGVLKEKDAFGGVQEKSFYTPASAILKSYSYLDESGKTDKKYFNDMMLEGEKKARELNSMVESQNRFQNESSVSNSSYTDLTDIKDANGKTFKAGVKNGKWYNIQTGKPL